jgi:hypothetical protein
MLKTVRDACKPKTAVTVVERSYDEETGTATLEVLAKDAGKAAHVYWDTKPAVTKNNRLTDPKHTTNATRLWFLALDPSGDHEAGAPEAWSNRLTITHQPREGVGSRTVELRVVPRGTIKYTLNGANPAEGAVYTTPIEVGTSESIVYCYADDEGVSTRRNFTIPRAGNAEVRIDPGRKAKLKKRIDAPATPDTFKLVARAKQIGARLSGASVEVGTGARNASLRFGSETSVTAEHLEVVIAALRTALGEEMADVRVTARAIDFGNGHDLSEFVKEWGLQVGANEVEQ